MKVSSNKAIDVYKYYRSALNDLYGEAEAESMIAILFDDFFLLKRHEILAGIARRLSESELLTIHFAVKDLLNKRPLQYITGNTWFYGEKFNVNESVLIPRRETEELCNWIIDDYKSNIRHDHQLKILDIGTGSGCIAITLKKHINNSTLFALDISEDALKVASNNAITIGVEVSFIGSDIMNIQAMNTLGIFDIIVSNPPYVRESEKELMDSNVTDSEPHLALFVTDENPLVYYERISDFSLTHLNKGGSLYFEINEYLSINLKNMLSDKGFVLIEIRKDMQNKPRMLKCQLSE
jgi:release factor glutamine methyltransferase